MEQTPSHTRAPAPGRVKNKAPAPIQITAEQLLREAWERKESGPPQVPKQHFADQNEVREYQRTQRGQYEMRIVRNRSHTPLWQRYARWEESQQDFPRARSIWERALDNDYRNPVLWLSYAEMEMRHRFINHARNILDRAVALLPRVDQIWLKYAHMEEMLEQFPLARLIYSRWLQWLPGPSAFFAAIRFELRLGEPTQARRLYEQLVRAHATSHSYVKYAKFEERHGEFARARAVYERATEELSATQLSSTFFLSFAKFEECHKQPVRARAIYNFALGKLPKSEVDELHRAFTTFEKQQGDREILDDLLVRKKRAAHTATLANDPHDYDTWYDLLQLEEAHSPSEQIRATYEAALKNEPPAATKLAWRRYVYLWIAYAVWAELASASPRAAVDIYARCIACIPHRHRRFSFAKLWTLYAQGHVRNGNLGGARRALGAGIGVLPGEDGLYRTYVAMETGLGEFGRARGIYQSWLERMPQRGDVWLELAGVEKELGEGKRVAGVLRVATRVEGVSCLHEIWEGLIEVEGENGTGDEGLGKVWEEFVGMCRDARAWLGYAKYAMTGRAEKCREVFERAARMLKGYVVEGGVEREKHGEGLREIVKAWLAWEEEAVVEGETEEEGSERVGKVRALMPERVKRKRAVGDGRWEEVWETLLPEERIGENLKKRNRLLMEAARKWKEGRDGGSGEGDGG